MNDTDIIAAIAPDAVSLMDKAIAEIKRLRYENATLTAERDKARIQVCILGAVTTKLKQAPKTTLAEAMQIGEKFGWDCFSNEEDGK